MNKLWAGRYEQETAKLADDFNSSIRFDSRMYRQDITGSMAHASMLGHQGIITMEEAEALIAGLRGILADLDSGALTFDPQAEDIHMFVEQVLTERLGDVGKKLHTARSRNDQVALDLRMYLRNESAGAGEAGKALAAALTKQAEGNLEVIMPGYTHLQRAQPILFSHHMMAYAMMLLRDLDRLGGGRGGGEATPPPPAPPPRRAPPTTRTGRWRLSPWVSTASPSTASTPFRTGISAWNS